MATTSASNGKTNAILAWLFAPITSLIWMNDPDDFLKHHAKQSLYFSAAMIVGHILFVVIGTILSFVLIGFICWLIWPLWWLVHLAGTVIGIVKANNGEKWVVPVVGTMVK